MRCGGGVGCGCSVGCGGGVRCGTDVGCGSGMGCASGSVSALVDGDRFHFLGCLTRAGRRVGWGGVGAVVGVFGVRGGASALVGVCGVWGGVGALVGYTELGLSDLLLILVLGLQLLLLSLRYFGLFYICLMRVLLMST